MESILFRLDAAAIGTETRLSVQDRLHQLEDELDEIEQETEAQKQVTKQYATYLSDLIDDSFSEEDLEELAFNMQIDIENVAGRMRTKRGKVISLLVYCQQRERIPELLDELRKARPGKDWPDR